MNMNDMIKKLGDMIAQKQMNNIIEDVENTLGDMELLSGKELMSIVMKHDMETANKVFEIYKKNQNDNGVVITAKDAYESGKIGASKHRKKTSTSSYSASCGSSSSAYYDGGCGGPSGYINYSGGCGCGGGSSSSC